MAPSGLRSSPSCLYLPELHDACSDHMKVKKQEGEGVRDSCGLVLSAVSRTLAEELGEACLMI